MGKYLHPSHRAAIAVCDRCKFKMPYNDLMMDGDKPGLRVCLECRDVKDPWKLPRPREKPITLRFPRPDIDLTVTYNYITTDTFDGNMRDQELNICTESGQRIIIG